jgi:hypothetical protein
LHFGKNCRRNISRGGSCRKLTDVHSAAARLPPIVSGGSH